MSASAGRSDPAAAPTADPRADGRAPHEANDVREALLLSRGGAPAPVDALVPCYRSDRHLPRLLETLFAPPAAEVNLCLVVDGDGWDPRPAIRAHVPAGVAVRAVALSETTGYARATNRAARLGEAPLVLLLNADVTVPRGHAFLPPLLHALRAHPEAAAAGPCILDPSGRIESCGSAWDARRGSYEHILRGAPADADDPRRTEPAPRDMMTAACLLLRRPDWAALGGLDERYRRAYWEDTDLCMRLRARGRTIRYVPASRVLHAVGHSGASEHPEKEANRRLFHRRWVETGFIDRLERSCARPRAESADGRERPCVSTT
jgi:GT2 family glycosyltransferase